MFSMVQANTMTELEKENRILSRMAAQEGIVLLKNDGVLPVAPCLAALYGNGARKTVKGGCGSGDVNERYVVSFEDGLVNAGFTIADKTWLEDYDQIFEKDRLAWKRELLEKTAARRTHIDVVYLETPHLLPCGSAIEKGALPAAEAAFYVIARRSTEGNDRQNIPGDYELAEVERENILLLASHYKRFILILNVPGPINITQLQENKNINAIVLISEGGLEAGNAAAGILTGAVTPSGHLSDTWARQYCDYPYTEGFSYQGGRDVFYREGIHVGYRWFDQNGIIPLYPFGFGLSYTQFAFSEQRLSHDNAGIFVRVRVTNVGQFSGKETVQIYCSQPAGAVAKSKRVLVGFEKTRLLRICESEELVISVSWRNAASFDEKKEAWVLEPGGYSFYIGNSISDTTLVGCVSISEFRVLEQCQSGKMPEVSDNALETVQSLSLEQRLDLVTGSAPASQTAVIGNGSVSVVGAAGETARTIPGVPSLVMADGGSGIRLISHYVTDENGYVIPPDPMAGLERGAFSDCPQVSGTGTDHYQYCTSFPIGTMLAQTWNRSLLREVGRGVAREMKAFGVHLWLAPSVNIHRNPLCGRNFEYYSEDPLLTGELAAMLCSGVQETPGRGVTIKHFACNNQEYLRSSMNSVVSPQALREIYLRVFEIIVKKVQPAAVMTSYNQVNGVHAANNAWLCTEVARRDWGYRGIFMTDWGTTHHGESDPAVCMQVGNDLIMPGRQRDRELIKEAVEQRKIPESALDICAARVLEAIWRLIPPSNE